MRVSVIGAGYVGLVQAAVLANIGHEVLCCDSNPERVTALRNGECPIYEPELPRLLQQMRRADKLFFTDSVKDATAWGEAVFICVGTPPLPSGAPDMSQVEDVAKQIAAAVNDYKVIVNKSTVPPGTARRVRNIIREAMPNECDGGFDVVSNPEFLREGTAVQDAMKGERIVIGADTWAATAKMMQLYEGLMTQFICTDTASAEMIKYASNAFLATKISFVNAMAQICEEVGADITEVARGMGTDSRIGSQFLNAGLGWGGSCFGKDTSGLVSIAADLGIDLKIVKAAQEINDEMPRRFVALAREKLGGFQDRIVVVLGLAFKPNTDDMRDARSIPIVEKLTEEGAIVRVFDPVAEKTASKVLPPVEWTDVKRLFECADAAMVVTEWPQIKEFDWAKIQKQMRNPLLLDGRNMFDKLDMEQMGFDYYSVGR